MKCLTCGYDSSRPWIDPELRRAVKRELQAIEKAHLTIMVFLIILGMFQ